MKNIKNTFLVVLVIIVITLLLGYIFKDENFVYNIKEKYYVISYFSVAKIFAFILFLIITLIYLIKKIVVKRT